MSSTESNMLELGTCAPDFSLPNTNPNFSTSQVALSDFGDAKGIVVAFICNHCPYVVHIKQTFTEYARDYEQKGISVIAISANDITTHPMDGPDEMKTDAIRYSYGFPYLYDQTQEVAKAYAAACTPDLFLFDSEQRLVYRGQFDDSRPSNGIPVTGIDLRMACDALLAGGEIASDQKPSIGCNIKWKASES